MWVTDSEQPGAEERGAGAACGAADGASIDKRVTERCHRERTHGHTDSTAATDQSQSTGRSGWSHGRGVALVGMSQIQAEEVLHTCISRNRSG